MPEVTQSGMIPRQSIEGYVSSYAAAVNELKHGMEHLRTAAQYMVASVGSTRTQMFKAGELRDFAFKADSRTDLDRTIEDCQKIMQNSYWRKIVQLADIERCMSLKDQEALRRQLEQNELPPLTADNVEAFIAKIKTDLPDMVDRAIGEVFEALRPGCSYREYITNQKNAFVIGKRVIHTYGVDSGYSRLNGLRLNYRAEPFFRSLDSVFHLLEGKLPPTYPGGAVTQMRTQLDAGQTSGEVEYWKWKAFQNGNVHIEFKRLDLLAQLNVICGKGKAQLKNGGEA